MLSNIMERMPRKPSQPRKPKHHAGQIKTHVSLSFTVPIELEVPMNWAAAAKGNRSQYICWLVMEDIRTQERRPPQGGGKTLLPKVPPRIRRRPESAKKEKSSS
jgi:hypothetical protein